MKRVSNWVFGGFFRSIGRFLFYILIGIILLMLSKLDVSAATSENWASQLTRPDRAWIYSCESDTSCTNQLTSNYNSTSDLIGRYETTLTTPTYGFAWTFDVGNMIKPNIEYSITGYFCNGGLKTFIGENLYGGDSLANSIVKNNNIHIDTTSTFAISSYPDNNNVNVGTCYNVKYLFHTDVAARYLTFKLDHNSNGNNIQEYFYGYDLSVLGIAPSYLEETLLNSIGAAGLASSQDIQNTQENILDQVQQTEDNINNQISDGFNSSTPCLNLFDKNNVTLNYEFSNTTGDIRPNNNYFISDYIEVLPNTSYIFSGKTSGSVNIFYDSSKNYVSNSRVINGVLTIPNNSNIKYIRFNSSKSELNSIMFEKGTSSSTYCAYGSQVPVNRIDETNDLLRKQQEMYTNETENPDGTCGGIICNLKKVVKNVLNLFNPDISGSSSSGAGFFNNFSDNDHGLSSIVSIPLNTIQNLTNNTCQDLQIPFPFLNNKNLTLPCLTPIYNQYLGVFFTLYQGIILAILSYRIALNIFHMVQGFKNPDEDKIEVMDL